MNCTATLKAVAAAVDVDAGWSTHPHPPNGGAGRNDDDEEEEGPKVVDITDAADDASSSTPSPAVSTPPHPSAAVSTPPTPSPTVDHNGADGARVVAQMASKRAEFTIKLSPNAVEEVRTPNPNPIVTETG
jgi:hypothetical protein